jgi:hypothetical protein
VRKIVILILVGLGGLLIVRGRGAGDAPSQFEEANPDFTFVRLIYSGGGGWRRGRGSSWSTDFPKADNQLLYAIRKLTDLSFIQPESRALSLNTDEIFEYPFLYAVEVGHMRLSDEEAARLREYLLRGGFLMVDDFHGTWEWDNFYQEIKRVLPEYEPEDLPLSHPIFHCYFDIDALFQIPGLQFLYSGRTWEKDGRQARYMGIRDDSGRVVVMINHNVDLGDAWEWAELEEYPRQYAHLAFKLTVNYIVYAMTH